MANLRSNYALAVNIESIEIDFLEQLARSVVDTTVSSVVFKTKDADVPVYWLDFLDVILENNNLERLIKTDVRYKSLYGKSYVGFDMYLTEWNVYLPIIWIAENNANNEALRFNGMKPFAVRVRRTYATLGKGSPILQNEVTYTKNDMTYLFLGGFGLGNIINPTKARSDFQYQRSLTAPSFPWNYVSLKTPDYILQNHKQGTHPHNYGVIPVQEFLNKDVADYIDDSYLSDWYPAEQYIPLVSHYLKYIAWEMNLDHTRVMGMFSNQDMRQMNADAFNFARSLNPNKRLEEAKQRYFYSEMQQMGAMTGEDEAVRKRLLIRAIGSEGSKLEKMNSTFDGEKHVKGLQSLISLIYKICGYSWAVEETSAVYENIQQTQRTLRSVYETTKEKVELFTRQWKGFLIDLAYAYFRINTNLYKTMQEVKEEFKKYIDFVIISNIIINQNNDWRKNMELHNNKLISTRRALELIWPEMTKQEIDLELQQIKDSYFAEESILDFNAFNNSKPITQGNKLDQEGE